VEGKYLVLVDNPGEQIVRKGFLSVLTAALMIGFASVASSNAQTRTMKDMQRSAKVKSKVVNFGTEPRVKVVVELEDGETIKGYVGTIADDSFVVEDPDRLSKCSACVGP
jgi:Na+/serine symporter